VRPLRLEVNGLTCFRDQVEIDFGALSLVAIEGPTGAGKSSLLDAMILALYGVVPRMGAVNLAELISHGRSGLSVTFDFEVRGQRWRVARTVNRKRPSQAILSELVLDADGVRVEKKKSNGVNEVQKEVRALLGIDVTAFQQAVILPQGKFQEFLQSTPGDRRKILSELLGFQVYATMRQKASDIANRLSAEVAVLARQLAGDLAVASAELIAELELQLGLARAERDVTQGAAEAARVKLTEIERVAARCLELKAIDDALVQLQDREAMVVAAEARVARARAVMPVAPLVARVHATTARVSVLDARLSELAQRVAGADKALELANDTARDAEIAAEQIVALRARIALLDEARGRFEQRDELLGRVSSASVALDAARIAETKAEVAVAAALATSTAAAGRLAALEALDVPAVAAETLAQWEALRETASRLGAARSVLEREQGALVSARAAETKGEGELATAEVERKRKEHGELQAEDTLEAARVALAAAEQTVRVGLVREHLHAGDACPVCEQTVAVVPAVVVGDAVSGLREMLAAQRILVERARAEGERARARVAEARARVNEAATRVGEGVAQLAKTTAAVAADEVALRVVVDEGESSPEASFRAGLQALALQAQQRAAHVAAIDGARTALTRATLEHDRHGATHAAAKARRAELELTTGDAKERLSSVEASLAGLGSQDPKKERASLERVIAGLDERKTSAVAAASKAREAASQVAAEKTTLQALAAEASADAAAASEALQQSGWTAEDVRRAALSDAELASAEALVAAHRAARAAKVAEREAVVRALGPLRAGLAEVEVVKAEVVAQTKRAMDAAAEAAILGERLRHAQQQLERAGGVRAEHETKARQLQIYRRVADDLSPKNFQEFLLEEVIHDLVRGASERLFGLSGGRYRMAADSSAGFLVVDLDHAGERRSTDTLSGGETFLASLAMALELSEQIRAKAGRVDLDCIFIDEGFGTLDPEALETVTEAVEGLQRPGRLVGIITHVAELARRMPERLIVEKSQAGSTVRVATS